MLGFSGWSFNVRFMTHLCHFLHNSLNSNSPYKRDCIQCWEEDSNNSFVLYVSCKYYERLQKTRKTLFNKTKVMHMIEKGWKGLSCHHTCWVHNKDGLHLSRKNKGSVFSCLTFSSKLQPKHIKTFYVLLLVLDLTLFGRKKKYLSKPRDSKVNENGVIY